MSIERQAKPKRKKKPLNRNRRLKEMERAERKKERGMPVPPNKRFKDKTKYDRKKDKRMEYAMDRTLVARELLLVAKDLIGARQRTAGVSVKLDLPKPRDVFNIAWSMRTPFYKVFGKDVEPDMDGLRPEVFTGGINVYVYDEDVDRDVVEKVLSRELAKYKSDGFKFGPFRWDKSNSRNADVLRVEVTKNPDEALADLEPVSLRTDDWDAILERLRRVGDLSDKHKTTMGEMPIAEFMKAGRDLTLIGDKPSKRLHEIYQLIIKGKKHGARELRWS